LSLTTRPDRNPDPRCAGSVARARTLLRRHGLTLTEVNIWTDPATAAAVRATTGGYGTMPTVDVAGQCLVNPSAELVLQLFANG
jgi:hypothetical protein